MKKKPVKKKAKKKLGSKSPASERSYQERLELICALITQTASLELSKGEYIELAPLPGVCGPFRLSGNSLPVFEYRVFDPRKNPFMMEFVKVRVEISKPDRIQFIAKIDSEGSADPARHGEEVEVLAKYREPFERLSLHLRQYFPYYRAPAFDRDPNRWDNPKTLNEASAVNA